MSLQNHGEYLGQKGKPSIFLLPGRHVVLPRSEQYFSAGSQL